VHQIIWADLEGLSAGLSLDCHAKPQRGEAVPRVQRFTAPRVVDEEMV
jgi:hypothetical protein